MDATRLPADRFFRAFVVACEWARAELKNGVPEGFCQDREQRHVRYSKAHGATVAREARAMGAMLAKGVVDLRMQHGPRETP